jgi:hypothetical protein
MTKFPFSSIALTSAIIAAPVLVVRGAALWATKLEAARAAQQTAMLVAQAQHVTAAGRAAIDQAAARAIDAGTMAVTFDRLAAHPDLARQVAGMPWLVPFLLGFIAALLVLVAVQAWQARRNVPENSGKAEADASS